MNHEKSHAWFERASHLIPGGVNSPVRSFKHVGIEPVYFERGEGAYLFDVDGNQYIDFCLSFGPHLLGHTPRVVVDAVQHQVTQATSFGACHPKEVQLAEQILRAFSFLDRVRLVNSGTEAVMTAIRLARGATHREKVVMFEGCYHGHSDSLLAKSGSGVAALSEAASRGVPASIVHDTLIARYDQLDSLEAVFQAHPGQIAALILEPIPANYGLWIPSFDHIRSVCTIAKDHGALVIFDEVISGFRVGLAGASGYFDLKPDLVTLGKVVGGGLPMAAVVGRREVMDNLAPVGDVYQAGTLSGNPLAAAAGSAVLEWLFANKVGYTQFEKNGDTFFSELRPLVERAGGHLKTLYSLFWLHFGDVGETFPPTISDESKRQYSQFFKSALAEGLYLAPSPYEVGFLSFAHTPKVLSEALEKFSRCLK